MSAGVCDLLNMGRTYDLNRVRRDRKINALNLLRVTFMARPKNPSTARGSDFDFVRRVLIVVAIAAVVGAIWALSDIILLLFGSILVAVVFRAIADPIARRLRIRDRWALALAGLLVVSSLAVGIFLFGAQLANQMRGLFEQLPMAFGRLAEALQLGSFADLLKGSGLASSLGNLASKMFTWGTSVLGALASVVLVIFGGIYLAADPQLYREGFIKLIPPAFQSNVSATLDDAGTALRRWLAGQLIAMVLVGGLTGLGLWIVGVPSAMALGFIAGLAEFVPILGAIVAAVPAIVIASTQGWEMVLWAVGVLVIVQQIENNLIAPVLAKRMVSVAPVVGLFAVVAMGVLFGPLGLLFGFPLAIVTDIAVRRLYVLDTLDESVEIMGKPAKSPQDPDTVETRRTRKL
jgi:predicted PurR-regulated permease PerM